MYVREHINCEEVFVKSLQDLESIAIKMTRCPVGWYQPASTDSVFCDTVTSLLKDISNKPEFILLGDFDINRTENVNRKKTYYSIAEKLFD